MFNLNNLIRPNIKFLDPYSSARSEHPGKDGIFLDANENPFGNLNRYPDPLQTELKLRLSEIKNIPTKNIFIGNGSDEIIDLVFRIFCEPGTDEALTFFPSYGMYQVCANINDVGLTESFLDDNFQIYDEIFHYLKRKNFKAIFICSPNNPTGNLIDRKTIEKLLSSFEGIVVIDEAYADFSEEPSWKEELNRFPNLIVMQTLSKAWGLAGARIGFAFANESIIALFNKVKPPYNVSALNQHSSIEVLGNLEQYQTNLNILKKEKEKMRKALEKLSIVKKVHRSDTNFFLVEVTDADTVYNNLLNQNIIVRNRHKLVKNCLRITVGKPSENIELLKALKNEESTFSG